jgi:hypothetical protein
MSGLTVRAVAREVGLSPTRVHEILHEPKPEGVSVTAYLDRDDEDTDPDPWTDEELPPALEDDVTDVMLTPPFTFAGLVEVVDRMPTRKQRDGPPLRALQWRDANSCEFGEVELCMWRAHREAECLPGDFADRETYLAAWDAMTAEVEAAQAEAWGQVAAAGLVYDDARRQWVQRPRAV